MYESPYQSMVENEVLFQQQPWLSRVPHQVRHALTPVGDALTGAGVGVLAGSVLGRPQLGAAVGGALGGLHGIFAPSATPAQHWAFNNPEKVHVLKARAAYDGSVNGAYEMGKVAALRKMANPEDPAAVEALHQALAAKYQGRPSITDQVLAAEAAQKASAPPVPPSNLRRNLAIGAAAVTLPLAAYTAYRHFTKDPHEEGKTAMLRALGL